MFIPSKSSHGDIGQSLQEWIIKIFKGSLPIGPFLNTCPI